MEWQSENSDSQIIFRLLLLIRIILYYIILIMTASFSLYYIIIPLIIHLSYTRLIHFIPLLSFFHFFGVIKLSLRFIFLFF